MDPRPILRTHRFLAPSTSTPLEHGRVWDEPACRDAWFAHRVELDRAPEDLEAAFRVWDLHHAGKGVERRYVCWETDVDEPWAAVPERCAPVRMWGLVRGGAEDLGPEPALPVRPVEDLDRFSLIAARQHPEYGPTYPRYLRHQLGLLRGLGATVLAAWDGERPVASATIVPGPDRWYRFQEVWTDRAWRRRGLCGALVRRGLAFDPGGVFVVCSVDGSDALRIYERAGFARVSRFVECSTPTEDAVTAPA
ncbi:MAG: GNAT family N-acetyltransferase [Alphaproteobacteria bacterium]|nr:GNAT family N-acetyltransferase [Alphaproteobacteria bacterium]